MFVVYCPVCDRRSVVGVDQVDWVQTLVPGMISVSGHCPRGHHVVELTGRSFAPPGKPRQCLAPRKPEPRRRRGLTAWLRRHFEADHSLPGLFYRF